MGVKNPFLSLIYILKDNHIGKFSAFKEEVEEVTTFISISHFIKIIMDTFNQQRKASAPSSKETFFLHGTERRRGFIYPPQYPSAD